MMARMMNTRTTWSRRASWWSESRQSARTKDRSFASEALGLRRRSCEMGVRFSKTRPIDIKPGNAADLKETDPIAIGVTDAESHPSTRAS